MSFLISLLAAQCSASLLTPKHLDPKQLKLGFPFAHGAFGSVHDAYLGQKPCIAKRAKPKNQRAADLLHGEAVFNQELSQAAPGSHHLAPFLGICSQCGIEYLIWEACQGARQSLLSYLEPAPGSARQARLATSLGLADETTAPLSPLTHGALVRTTLHEMLSALAIVHSKGLVHRDVKPENFLVDCQTHSLRLIDLGAACEAEKCDVGPSTELYAPPEQTCHGIVCDTFDVFSAAIVWVQVISGAGREAIGLLRHKLYELSGEDSPPLAQVGMIPGRASGYEQCGSDGGHACSTKLSGVDVSGEEAWQRLLAFFSKDLEGQLAWELLQSMIVTDPRRRISSENALAHAYFR